MGGPVVAEQFGLPPYESLLDKGVYIINTRVYETLLDDDGVIHTLDKQISNPFYCKGYHLSSRTNFTVNQLHEELIGVNEKFKDAKITIGFPLGSQYSRDDKITGTIIFGIMYEAVPPDYNKAIIVEGECTPESRAKAISEACKTRGREVYFVHILPEASDILYDIGIHYVDVSTIKRTDEDK